MGKGAMSPHTDGRPDPTIPELLFPAEKGPPRNPEALREDLRRARGEAEREAKRWAGLAEAAYWASACLSKSRSHQALDDLTRDMPSGPHARLLHLALLNSSDPVATAEGVGQAAEAISDALQMITPVAWDD